MLLQLCRDEVLLALWGTTISSRFLLFDGRCLFSSSKLDFPRYLLRFVRAFNIVVHVLDDVFCPREVGYRENAVFALLTDEVAATTSVLLLRGLAEASTFWWCTACRCSWCSGSLFVCFEHRWESNARLKVFRVWVVFPKFGYEAPLPGVVETLSDCAFLTYLSLWLPKDVHFLSLVGALSYLFVFPEVNTPAWYITSLFSLFWLFISLV